MIRIQAINTIEQLNSLRTDWNAIAGTFPLRSWEWFYTWAETMLGDDQLCVAAGRNEAGRVVGIAPFYLQRNWSTGNVLRLMGDQRCCTDYSSIFTAPEHSETFLNALADWLVEAPGAKHNPISQYPFLNWDLIKLEATHHADTNIKSLFNEMVTRECRSKKLFKHSTWQVKFTGDWEDYVATLSPKQRRNVRRVEKRVIRNPDFQTRTAETQSDFETGMKWFRELHQKRWAAVGKPGCFSFPDFANFLDTLAPRMFEQNKLQISWIENSDRPVAVDFSFASDSIMYGYQMGVDPDYRKLEMGRALQVFVLKSALESGRTTFDFLRGSEAYKSRWGAEETKLMDLEIVPERVLPHLRQNVTELGRSLKKKVASFKKD